MIKNQSQLAFREIFNPIPRCRWHLPESIGMRLGSGCGSVGRAVASDTKGPRLESSRWQIFTYLLNICLLSAVY